MNPTNPFKILSIDGGGIKGLYSSTILQHFEEHFNCRLHKTFDMVCGTSTGGLIALGIAQGTPVEKLSTLYRTKGKHIFPVQGRLRRKLSRLTGLEKRWIQQLLWFGKYSAAPLKNELEALFKERTLGDTSVHLCIPAFCITNGLPRVFKNDHHDLTRDNALSLVDVALATTAAPTYLPIHAIQQENDRQYIDGGVWANNPTQVGYLEALRYFINETDGYDGIEILSVSSITHLEAQQIGWRKQRSFLGWNSKLLNAMMAGQSAGVHYAMSTIARQSQGMVTYERIDSPVFSATQQPELSLDITHDNALKEIVSAGEMQAVMLEKEDRIKKFFN